MTRTLRQLDCLDELLDRAGAWDDLWQRSEVRAPSARAFCIGNWLRHFAPKSALRVLIIEQDGQMVAALPLVERRLRKLLHVGSLPVNEWSHCGDLLIDPNCDVDAVADQLVAGLDTLPWKLLWIGEAAYETPRWVALRSAAERAGWSVAIKEVCQIPQVEIGSDWDTYHNSRKGNQRRSRRRYARMLDREGGVRLRVEREIAPEKVEQALRQGFEVEDRSWKGAAGTSVLKTPGMFEFYLEEARQMARWGMLELVFLDHQGQPIAFDYGWRAKAAHFTPKIGYDDAYRKFGPGQQLMMHLLERLHGEEDCRLLDFWGPETDWHGHWKTTSYAVGRVALASPRGVSPMLLKTFERWQKWRRHKAAARTAQTAHAP